MNRFSITLSVLFCLGGVFHLAAQSSNTQSTRKLTAPTFYIAATAENEGQYDVLVRGVTNLPPGAKLTVSISDYIGEGGSELSDQTFPVVGEDGFFKIIIYPKARKQFLKGSMVCEIVFAPDYPKQIEAVLRAVGGTQGIALPLPYTESGHNPQAGSHSGERWYLYDWVSIPTAPRLPDQPQR